MPEKELIIKEKLEHSGLFVFTDLYAFLYRWLEEEGYGIVEKKYAEKVTGNKRDITVEWEATKKFSDYYRGSLGIKIEATDLTDVEVEIDGQKKKMNKGKISVEGKGMLIIDPEGQWETSPFNRWMRDVYNKYIVPSRGESMKELVAGTLITLKEEVKAFLELTGKRK